MGKVRSEIADDTKWNVESLYGDNETWQDDYDKLLKESNKGWPEVVQYRGRIGDHPQVLRDLFDVSYRYTRAIDRVYTYAHLRHDEDTNCDLYKGLYTQGASLYHSFTQASSWINPAILALDKIQLEEYIQSEELKDYRVVLQQLLDQKDYVLSAEQEKILSLAGKMSQTPVLVFSALNNGDLKFNDVADSKGNLYPLTHGSYSTYLQSSDRVLRKNAFLETLQQFRNHENTLAEALNGVVQAHIFQKNARGYDACVEAALHPHQIHRQVYDTLITVIRESLPVLHHYVELRKKVLGLDEIHFYDMYVPLVEDYDIEIDYAEAARMVVHAVAPLGKEYQGILQQGLFQDRWVDVYENANKRSGAYSSGCYDSYPFILLNYTNTLRDLKTLAHEGGHSMHSFLSNKTQPYHYSHYPIFVAEVASTFNEELVFRSLMGKAKSKKEKIYLLCQNIEDIRATLFRQTMFAEFELTIHELAEKNVPLTPQLLKKVYRELNQAYFGEEFTIDEELDYELFRIPHYFYNFYVYQYATGMSAAHALVEKVSTEGESARIKYLKFLSSGGSAYPVDLLRVAGVDMEKPDAVRSLVRHFAEQVSLLEQELYSDACQTLGTT